MNQKQQFFEYLKQTSLSDEDKKNIMSIFNYLSGDHPSVFANRLFLFEGEPGIGKTFLAKKLISSINKPVVFLGQNQIFENVRRAKDLKELLKILENFNEGIVYIDDLKYIFNFNDFDDLDNADRHRFMKILESFRDNSKKTILIMTLNDSDFMDDSWRDRIDVHINFELPSNFDKLGFLREKFSEYVSSEGLAYLSENTIGYNYRDLPQVMKIAYYQGEKEISLETIKEALTRYTPSSLTSFNVKQGIKTKLKDLFLKEDIKKEFKRIHLTVKKRKELHDNNANKINLLIFEGPAGVGKTYSALALAGEMEMPLVKISAREVYGRRFGPAIIFEKVKRFQDAIVLIDDMDKLMEGDAYNPNDGGVMNSEWNSRLDELDKAALVILSVNDSMRLGRALRDRFRIIRFEKPGIEERSSYFGNIIKSSKIKFNITEAELANITEGMNYRDLQRFWNECIFFAIENNLNVLEKEHVHSMIGVKHDTGIRSSMFG